jgi:hypothetical protein
VVVNKKCTGWLFCLCTEKYTVETIESSFHVDVCCSSFASQVILKGYKEVEITGHENGTLGRVTCNFQGVAM